MNFPIDGEQQRDGVLGDRIRRVVDDADHLDPETCRCRQIDIVEPRAPQSHQLRAPVLEHLEHAGVGDIIDEDADCVMTGSERGGCRAKRQFEILQLVPFCNIRCVEKVAVIALGAVIFILSIAIFLGVLK